MRPEDGRPAPLAASATRALPRTVVVLGLVSLLNDASSEMITPLLPIFLTATLGAGPAIVGLVEGLAEATSSVLKLIAGRLADRGVDPKSLVLAGYGLSNATRPLIGLAAAWSSVLLLRFLDRVGKGFRTGLWGPVKQVLRQVDLTVAPGAIFGVLGPNGAGKTTLISILATLLLPDTGRAEVLGLDVVRQAARLKARINLAASGAHFLWCMTVADSLRFYGRLYGLGGRALKDKVEMLLDLFGLAEHRAVTFERLSTGLKQRLALAKAFINDPELLFLDEPTSGLDQEMAQHIRQEIVRLNRETGVTMLLTTHNLREA